MPNVAPKDVIRFDIVLRKTLKDAITSGNAVMASSHINRKR